MALTWDTGIMSLYDFRHRIRLPHPYLPYPENEIALHVPGFNDQRIVLRAARDPGTALRDSTSPLLLGEGFTSADEARRAGTAARSLLEKAFVVAGVAADFGDRAASGGRMSEAFKDQLWNEQSLRVLDDSPNLIVFEHSDAVTVFMGGSASGFAPAVREHLDAALRHPDAGAGSGNEIVQLAYELYSSSTFSVMVDVRFLLLMMALEVLIEQGPRTQAERDIIDEAIFSLETNGEAIPQANYNSLLGALRQLRTESIGQAGRRLVATLDNRRYGGKSAQQIFRQSYGVRSRLVHGAIPRPAREDVGLLTAHLEHLVRHLIAGPRLIEDVLGPSQKAPQKRVQHTPTEHTHTVTAADVQAEDLI